MHLLAKIVLYLSKCTEKQRLKFFLSFFLSSLIYTLYTSYCRCSALLVYMITLNDKETHTQTHSRTLWTRDRPVAKTFTCSNHSIHKTQTTMPPAGFEPAVPTNERPQTHALDRAVTGVEENLNTASAILVRNLTVTTRKNYA